jgi:hypothetical protein
MTTTQPSVSRLSKKCWILDVSQSYRLPRPVTGIASVFTITDRSTSVFIGPEQMLLDISKLITIDKFPIHYSHNFVGVLNSSNKTTIRLGYIIIHKVFPSVPPLCHFVLITDDIFKLNSKRQWFPENFMALLYGVYLLNEKSVNAWQQIASVIGLFPTN